MAKKKRPSLRDIVVDLDSRNMDSIVDMSEVDIFSPVRIARIVENEDPEPSEYRNILNELISVNDRLAIVNEKLTNLKGLFRIRQEGDVLNRSYKVTFNDVEASCDEVGDLILQSFIQDYSLDITKLCRDLRMTKDCVEAISLRGAKPYCEVDLLFDEKKEPVEC